MGGIRTGLRPVQDVAHFFRRPRQGVDPRVTQSVAVATSPAKPWLRPRDEAEVPSGLSGLSVPGEPPRGASRPRKARPRRSKQRDLPTPLRPITTWMSAQCGRSETQRPLPLRPKLLNVLGKRQAGAGAGRHPVGVVLLRCPRGVRHRSLDGSLDVSARERRKVGATDRIRTCDLCLRRAALYPAELRLRGSR